EPGRRHAAGRGDSRARDRRQDRCRGRRGGEGVGQDAGRGERRARVRVEPRAHADDQRGDLLRDGRRRHAGSDRHGHEAGYEPSRRAVGARRPDRARRVSRDPRGAAPRPGGRQVPRGAVAPDAGSGRATGPEERAWFLCLPRLSCRAFPNGSVTYLLALEEIAAADASVAVSLSIHNAIPTTMLVRHGSSAQKDRWLKAMARGELLAGFALSEPESGSDAASLTTRAVRDGASWVLSGAKAWATNGGTADLMMVMARSERGIGAFIVPTDASGYRPGKPEDKMGLRASNTVALTLEDVRLPADHLLGEEGEGFGYAMEGLDAGRLGIAVPAGGI